MKYYYQFDSDLGHDEWPLPRADQDRHRVLWWADNCHEVEASTVEQALRKIILQQNRHLDSNQRLSDGDTEIVFLSESPDAPGRRYQVGIEMVVEVLAVNEPGKKRCRLPTAEEVAESQKDLDAMEAK